jgi:peptidoglycan/LPS O-acetylase OafA/YrhL
METIASRMSGRVNNFNALRLLAAFMVLFSHSYPIAGKSDQEPLSQLTKGATTLGEMAVAIFFVISGLLVTRSFISKPKMFLFFRNRCIRIFPGLFACVLFCVFIYGPIFTKIHIKDYFAAISTRRFLLNGLLWTNSFQLEGVFGKADINGSLWTLPIEFAMYCVVAVLGFARALNRPCTAGILVLLIIINTEILPLVQQQLGRTHVYVSAVPRFGLFFLIGMVAMAFSRNIALQSKHLLAACLVLGLSIWIGIQHNLIFLAYAFALSYIVGFAAFVRLPAIEQYVPAFFRGDLSYGVYLYAFPVQVAVYHILGDRLPFALYVITSSLITLVLALASWHLVESPFLQFKARAMPTKDETPLNAGEVDSVSRNPRLPQMPRL